VITSERELQAALKWIEYWKSTRTVGQSWIGNEQAGQKISELRRQIDAYRRLHEDPSLQSAPPPALQPSPEP
jgi:hypothetical protein